MSLPSVSPQAVWALLCDPAAGELALLDVREARAFVAAHPLLARHAPLSSLELEIGAFVPRPATPVVLYDAHGDPGGPAAPAAVVLGRLGYSDVRVLAGGLAAWTAEGLPVAHGFGALIKAFGGDVRRRHLPPAIDAAALRARLRHGPPVTLLDVRPADEYRFLTLPGAVNCPGTELPLAVLPDAGQGASWALHCFSRTRGILATATLRLLGATDVVWVEDGVMGWGVQGGPLVERAESGVPPPQVDAAALHVRAAAFRAAQGVKTVTGEQLSAWWRDAGRTLQVFDVRSVPDPAWAGTAVRHVPGAQLVMHVENLVGTRGGRVVLVDDPHGLRAAVAAFWLAQLGQFEVAVLEGAWLPPDSGLVPMADDMPAGIAPLALQALRSGGDATVVDVGPSLAFEQGHLSGALYLLPASLDPLVPHVPPGCTVVFTSPDGAAARLVARDARSRWPAARFTWLAGGTAGWTAATGEPLDTAWTPAQCLTPFDDDWGSVMRVFGPRRHAVWADYLQWERSLPPPSLHGAATGRR